MLNWFKDFITIYSTTRVVKIRSKFLALTYVILVILVWCAFLGSYELDFRNVYQKKCDAVGSITTKVKGVTSTLDLTDEDIGTSQPSEYRRLWDVNDIIFPPYGGNEFFVLTNIIITPNQTRENCPESKKVRSSRCLNSNDCKNGTQSVNGVRTGVCVDSTKTCEVSSWCPIEEDVLPLHGARALLEGTQDFTLMIKNSISFPDCGEAYQRRNIIDNATNRYLTTCKYDPISNPYCPIFRIGDIVHWSGQNYSHVAITGGVFTIQVSWKCQFDWGISIQDCLPKYSFSRTDEANAKLAPGWNYRSAIYHDLSKRILTKQYGLKFIIEINGYGKKFDFLQAVLTIGASIGLFAVAPLVCDFLFDMICAFRNCFPLRKCYSDFHEGIRYQDHTDFIPDKITPTKYELSFVEMQNPVQRLDGNVNGGFHTK